MNTNPNAVVTKPIRMSGPARKRTIVLGILIFCGMPLGIILIAGTSAESIARADEKISFDKYDVVLGPAERQTVLTGFFLDGPMAELAVIDIMKSGDRRLRMYEFDDRKWTAKIETTLGGTISYVDVAGIGGRDRLITYAENQLRWFDPESKTEHALVEAMSNFNPGRETEIPHVNITQDLNGDGLDDLAVPNKEGFQLFIQNNDGTFADSIQIGPATDFSRIYGADGYRYDPWSQSRIHNIDYNQDGRNDLVFWNTDHFKVHLQNQHGLFAKNPKTFNTDIAFDSDDLNSLAVGDMNGKVLHSLADMNGDGIADMVVISLEGTKISKKHSGYDVHYGVQSPDGGTIFDVEVGTTFQSNDKIQLAMDRHDFDGDGQLDVMFTTIEARFLTNNPWKKWKGFWGDDIWLGLEFYRNEGGIYTDTPNATRKIQLLGDNPSAPGWVPLDLLLRGGMHESRKTQAHPDLVGGFEAFTKDWRRLSKVSSKNYPPTFNRTLLIGDVTGDGCSDLLIEETFRKLLLFEGVPGPERFARRPQKLAVAMPNDAEYARLVDLNKDGKQDILLHHPFTLKDREGRRIQPPGTEPHRLTVMLAR